MGLQEQIDDLGYKDAVDKKRKKRPSMSPPQTSCHPNGRKIIAKNCNNSSSAMWGCVTVNDGVTPEQVPQIGQVVYGFATYNGNNVYYEIQQVFPADVNLNNPGDPDLPIDTIAIGCGYDCDPVTYDCNWNGSGNAPYSDLTSCESNCTQPILGCMDSTANNYDPLATVDDGSCEMSTPCMKVTLINTCPQNSSYSTYYGTPGVPSPGGTWNMNWGQGPNFGCATINNQTPTLANVGTFIEGGTGVSGEQWEVHSIEPATSTYSYNLNTTSC